MVIEQILAHYFEKPPRVMLMEDYEINQYELHYYLYSYTIGKETKHLLVLEGGLDVNEDRNSVAVTTERLKEHAGVTVLGWHVLNSAKATLGKAILSSKEAGMNLEKLLLDPNPTDMNEPTYTLIDVALDFNPNVYTS